MRYLAVLLMLVLSACASTGTRVEQEKLAAFVKGKTTYSEVIQQLGKPDHEIIDNAEGAKTLIYTFKQTANSAASYIPFVGGFIEAGAGSDDTTVMIKLDSKSVLTGYTVTDNKENQ